MNVPIYSWQQFKDEISKQEIWAEIGKIKGAGYRYDWYDRGYSGKEYGVDSCSIDDGILRTGRGHSRGWVC